jgi:hypothetical protein
MACALHYIHSQLYAYLGLGLGAVYTCTYITYYILYITGSVQIIFIYTIKYDNIYSTFKVNNHMRYEQYMKKYSWDISPENGKGFALFLICSK